MTATPNGTSTGTLHDNVSGTKESILDSLLFRPDLVTNLRTLDYRMTSPTDGSNGQAGIQTVMVSAVPGPASFALLAGIGGFMFCGMRRQRTP